VTFDAMIDELRAIFAKHQKDGKVTFLYSTKLYFRRLRRFWLLTAKQIKEK